MIINNINSNRMKNLITSTTARFLKSCLIFLLCVMIWLAYIYGMIAFYYFEIDPSKWGWDGKYFMVSFGFVIGIIVAGVATSFIMAREHDA